jgi:4-alpha-glucanotransferase
MRKIHPFFSSIEHLATDAEWTTIGKWHHHGLCFPLASIRGQKSFGIGEFLDLLPMIDWLSTTGFDTLQLLPLNDSGKDPSPYSAHSALALHPIYLSLWNLPHLELFPEIRAAAQKEYPYEKRISYLQVLEEKEKILKQYFLKAFPLIRENPAYQDFVKQNPWVEQYALYKALKEAHLEKPWWEWEEKQDLPVKEDELHFHTLLQYLAFDQMRMVKEAAEKKGIFLKGDIPILLNRDSADVWMHKELFLLDFSAGAPPDMYNQEGQDWGFPLYNWQEHEKEGYAWWKRRLLLASSLYHIFRIDHVVGFFRIWAIPPEKTAKEGYFFPADESLWISQGSHLLQMMIGASPMLPIGEDLGAVPPSVRRALEHLGVPGTKVLRWERHWNEDGSFISPSEFHPLSMSCLSTHDSEPLAEWWKAFPQDSLLLCNTQGWNWQETLSQENRQHLLTLCHASNSLFHINLIQEYLALFEELSWDPEKEDRINIPGTLSPDNWTWRQRPYLQEIINHKGLFSLLQELSKLQ